MLKDVNLEQKEIEVATAQKHLAALVEEVRTNRYPKVLTQDGQPAAILVNAEVYQAILDYLEELEDAEDNRIADEMSEKIARGEVEMEDWERVKAEWEADGFSD